MAVKKLRLIAHGGWTYYAEVSVDLLGTYHNYNTVPAAYNQQTSNQHEP